ncbi:MAG: ATP phosphoribosyltransferase regulatory subunit, partial [Myxococcales bacterium]|nr:ATP phosphoribosyltransferase regulatory subunit [Myxococcales bacterium]
PGLQNLRAVLGHLEAWAPEAHADALVDLGEVRGHGYYTGLRIRVWARGAARPIVRGGRYDGLLARYGRPSPATGLAIDLDALEDALHHAGRGEAPRRDRAGVLIVVDDNESARVQAGVVARALRAEGARVSVQAGLERAAARALAERLEAREIIELARQGPRWRARRERRDGDAWHQSPEEGS